MPNERREGLDRRDFVMAAIGLGGASASRNCGHRHVPACEGFGATGTLKECCYTSKQVNPHLVRDIFTVGWLEDHPGD